MVIEMDSFLQRPMDYSNLSGCVDLLKKEYDFIKCFYAGKSVLKRKIYTLGIGNLKSATLYAGAFHGQEWLTASILLKYFNELCHCYQNNTRLLDFNVKKYLDQRGLIVVPMVNPDGVEIGINGAKSAKGHKKQVEKIMSKSDILWQANANGVDINHNFDAGFEILQELEKQNGITAPAPSQYSGKQPASEPETKAIMNLCMAFNVNKVIAFHSQGEEIYYSYGENTPKPAELIGDMLANACGYKLTSPTGIASHGGFKDWFIEKQRKCGFTIEIGRGQNPLPITELNPIYARLYEALLLGMII